MKKFLLALVLATSGSCGSGGSSAGGSDPEGIVRAFQVSNARKGPARIAFELVDDESKGHHVELLARVAASPPRRLTRLAGRENPSRLAASPDGVRHELDWDFSQETFLPADGGFVGDVTVFLRLDDEDQLLVPGSNAAIVGLGDDAPGVSLLGQPETGEGSLDFLLAISDSTGDPVSVRVEFDQEDDQPDLGWSLARPLGVDSTPALAIENVTAPANGTRVAFAWDSASDLVHRETRTRLRFTATDGVKESGSVQSRSILVDNNEGPRVELEAVSLELSEDQRHGIPIRYHVADPEGDPTTVVFQWRRDEGEFPELPASLADLEELLADPARRREAHVCTELPIYARGHLFPRRSRAVRLPELGASEAWILAGGIVGSELEVLRASSVPEPVRWSSNVLVAPVSVLPLGDGLTALALDAPGGMGRLQVLELATGRVAEQIASFGPGNPTAMALERGERAALVATESVGSWRIERVDLESLERRELASGDLSQGPVRGIASLGSGAAAFTVGSSLVQVDYFGSEVRSRTVFGDLDVPWGLALDPRAPGRLYLAEHGSEEQGPLGRILVVDLVHRSREKLAVLTSGPAVGLGRPEAIALEGSAERRLLVVKLDPATGMHDLIALDLTPRRSLLEFNVTPLVSRAPSIATGPDGLRVLVLEDGELLIGGGLEQRRTIASYDPRSCTATVDPRWRPRVRPGQPWRIRGRTPQAPGAARTFVWDSSDALAGPVHLRAQAWDQERAPAEAISPQKRVRFFEPVPTIISSSTASPVRMIAADLNGDGDLEFVSANLGSDSIRIVGHSSPLLGGPATTLDPCDVTAQDFDGDGRLDLACANRGGDDLTVFFQDQPVFSLTFTTLQLGGAASTAAPTALVSADLDGDGVPEIACANAASGTVAVFGQSSPRTFTDSPRILDQLTEPVSLAAGDLDGDGDLDLAAADRAASNLTLYLQTGAGSFDVPSVVGGPGITSSPVHVVAVDVDLDGRLDLASANSDRSIAILGQDDSGLFDSNPLVLRDDSLTEYPRALAFGDLEGDGDLDLAAACDASGLSLFLNDPARPFAELLSLHPGPLARPSSVVIADQDGDGTLDLCTANLGSDNLTVFSRRPSAFDGAAIPMQTTSTSSLSMGDLDQDGDLDLATFGTTSSPPGASLTLHHQIRPRTFERAQDVPHVAGPGPTIAPVDLDGDGDLDLLTRGLREVVVFVQGDGGVFAPDPLTITDTRRREPTDPAGGIGTATPEEDLSDRFFFLFAAAPADLDRDGDLDIAVSTSFGLDLYLQEGRLAAEFRRVSADHPDSPGFAPGQLEAADVDGDGRVDLIAPYYSGATVLFQSGPGTYDPHRLSLPTESLEVRAIAVGDYDGDGDADIAAFGRGSSGIDGMVEAHSQRQPRAFELSLVTRLDRYGSTLIPVDLDRDDDLDLVAAEEFQLAVLLQRSPGRFELATELGSAGLVRAGDIDGDGSCDILSKGGFTNNFRLDIYWGRR